MNENNMTPPPQADIQAVSPDMTVNSQGTIEQPTLTAPPQPVMDVTPPPEHEQMPSLAPEPPVQEEVATEPTASADGPAPEAPTIPSAVPTAMPEAPAAEGNTNTQPPLIAPTGSNPAPIAAAPAKKGGKGMIIIVAVVLALVLAALTVVLYLKGKDDNKKTAAAKNALTQTVAKANTTDTSSKSVTGTDVDTASKSVDSSLTGVDDSKDFSANALSDKSLGLQ